MRHFTATKAFASTTLIVLSLVLFGVLLSEKPGYGQNPGQVAQATTCQPFQQTVIGDVIGAGAVGAIKVSPRTTVTIEQIALRIDATNYIVPAVAVLTTSVRSVRSAYYLPIPATPETVIAAHPLTLMQRVQLHADGGTDIAVSFLTDGRYPNGTGRAEWSVSGLSCAG